VDAAAEGNKIPDPSACWSPTVRQDEVTGKEREKRKSNRGGGGRAEDNARRM